MLFADAVMLRETLLVGFTPMTMALEVTGEPVAQLLLEVRIQRMVCPLDGVIESVVLLVPVALLSTVQLYKGLLPPFAATAVKVTVVPWQMFKAEAEMLIAARELALTDMVMVLEVAGLPTLQLDTELNTQYTASPFSTGV